MSFAQEKKFKRHHASRARGTARAARTQLLRALTVVTLVAWVVSGWPRIGNFPPGGRVARAAIALVQSANSGTANGGTSIAATFSATPISGNLLIAIAASRVSSVPSTPAGWSIAIDESGGDPGQIIFYKIAGAAESTTVTVSGYSVSTRLGLHIYSYSGIATTSPLDQTASASGTGTTPSSGTTAATTQANELLIAGFVVQTNTTGFAGWTNSFTERNDFGNLTALRAIYGGADRTVAATGTYSTTATTASGNWVGQIATFKAAPPTFTQSAYRWFANANSPDVGAALAAQDTAATVSSSGSPFRLRLLLHVGASALAISGQSFKLQFVGKGSGTCASPSGGTPAVYTDVTGATAVAYNNNATPVDGATVTANASDPTHGGDTVVAQTYEEANNFTNSVAAIPEGQDGKWDFSLVDNGAPASTTYCFRAVQSTGTALTAYSVYPQITTTASGTLTVDIVNSGGTSVASPSVALGTISSTFTCQTTTGTFGTSSERIRVTNTTGNPSWSVTVAATAGATALWSAGTPKLDFNDSAGAPAGCADGGDADSVGGRMTQDPSVATLSPQGGCSTTGLTLGSAASFTQGVTDTITLVTAGGTANTNCYWDLTGVGITQRVPSEQAAAGYTLDVTVTVTAI